VHKVYPGIARHFLFKAARTGNLIDKFKNC